MRARNPHRAFTLVELLIVVATILALLAILLPAMSRAIEAAHRAVCSSNLRQFQVAHLAFAGDHLGELTVGQAATGDLSQGVYEVWATGMSSHGANAPSQRFRGMGYLVKAGYYSDLDGRSLYCPSWNHDRIRLGGDRGWPAGGRTANLAPGQNDIAISYAYRSTFESPQFKPARLSRDAPGSVIMADQFAGIGFGDVDHHHRVGYNWVTIDGAVGWHDDPDQIIRNRNAGASYNQNLSGYLLQERVFTEIFERPR